MKAQVSEKEITHDPWLSKLLGREAYRIQIEGLKKESDGFLSDLKRKPVFLFAKIPASDTAAAAFLESEAFHLIDTNVTLEKDLNPAAKLAGRALLRFAQPEDEASVSALARRNCTTSRFHLDPEIPSGIADTVKAEWARNYFRGKRGDRMVVALQGKQTVGFLQLLLSNQNEVTIDLIATDLSVRRQGIAQDMIGFMESQFPSYSKVRVGTQVSNIPSLRLYEKLGFRICSTQYVFHYHQGSAR